MNSVTRPWEGCWQVIYDDLDEEIISYPPLFTTMSLRRSGLSIYTSNFFIEIRTASGRTPPAGWPATEAETIAGFKSASAHGGSCRWRTVSDGFEVEHIPTMSHDPKVSGRAFRYSVLIDGDVARVKRTGNDGRSEDEVWRRLSGAGSSPLAGAWESESDGQRWLYLVTAGHFGVMRQKQNRVISTDVELSDREIAEIARETSANAGARLETGVSFDHWPMITTGTPGTIDCRKHETFRIVAIENSVFVAALKLDATDATEWRRLQ